jgi:hypothetical protein
MFSAELIFSLVWGVCGDTMPFFPTFPLILMWECGEVDVPAAGPPYQEGVVHSAAPV